MNKQMPLHKKETLSQITTCFIELCEYNNLSAGNFNLHLYEDFIEASLCEEADLGDWVRCNYNDETCYSDPLDSRESINLLFERVNKLKLEFEKEYNL